MAANYDPNGEEGEWDGLTIDDVETFLVDPSDDPMTGPVELDSFAEWGPFELWLDVPGAEDARTLIATVLEATADLDQTFMQKAQYVMNILAQKGVVVINPQDVSWGSCKGHDGQPHEISTSLCVWCLEYDPE
jgi:hypothetical protein